MTSIIPACPKATRFAPTSCIVLPQARFSSPARRLKLDHVQAGDKLKVANVGGPYAGAQFQGADPDKKVRKRDAHTFRLALAVDLSGTESDRNRDWLDGDAGQEVVKE